MKRFMQFLVVTVLVVSAASMSFAGSISSAPVAMSGSVSLTPISDVLDDFDSMSGINNWGGRYNPLNVSSMNSVAISYDATAHAGNPCLKVSYNVPSSGDWAGMSIGLANSQSASRDISGYRAISFDIKGVDLGQSFKIEWKNTNQSTTSKVYLSDYLDRTTGTNSGTGTDWETVTIPFDAFANFYSTNSLKDLGQINFVFEHDYLVTFSGMLPGTTFYIDNIVFSTTAPNAVRIDSFGDGWGLNALGGNNGAFSSDSNVSNYCDESYDATTSSGAVRSWKLSYTVVSGGYCGTFSQFGGGSDWITAAPHDFSQYSKLKFRVKANSSGENPVYFKVELKDTDAIYAGDHFAYIPAGGVSTSWQEYSMDLTSFINWGGTVLNKAAIKEMNFTFEYSHVTAKVGVIYVDDIRFEK